MSDFFKIPHSSEGLIKPKSRLHQAFPREQLWPQPQSFLLAPNHGSSSPGARNGHCQEHIHGARHLFALETVEKVFFLCNSVFSKEEKKKMEAEKCWLIVLGKGENNLKSMNAETFGERQMWANTGAFLWMFNSGSLCNQKRQSF